MKIKKANLKRLVSLSALGAGALGVGGSAEASSIVYSGVLNEQIGFGPGYKGPVSIPGATLGWVAVRSSRFPGDLWLAVFVYGRNTASAQFEVLKSPKLTFSIFPVRYGVAQAFPLNGVWGSRSGIAGGRNFVPIVGTRVVSSYPGSPVTAFNRIDRYMMFAFTAGNKFDYGWAQLDVITSGRGANVTLVDYAYDTSGAQIPAGDTGMPEPSTFVLTGLAALALGAKGLRAWRAARKHSTSL